MKVKELVNQLNTLDQEADVFCYFESDSDSRIFDIEHISQDQATKFRDKDGAPKLKFGKAESSSSHVLINLLDDF